MSDVGLPSDFFPIFAQSLSACFGGSIYSVTDQNQLLMSMYGVSLPPDFVAAAPYPPWAVAFNTPLCLLSPGMAAKTYQYGSLLQFVVALLLLTEGMRRSSRPWILALASCFPFVLGLLAVGQWTMPVILGAAMLAYALPRENCWLSAMGISLLTFKPLVGAFIFACVATYLLFSRAYWVWKCSVPMIIIWVLFLTLSFMVEPHWMSTFFNAAGVVSKLSSNTLCDTCSSLTIALARAAHVKVNWYAQHMALFSFLGLGLAAALGAILGVLKVSSKLAVAVACCLALLLPTYLRNYDYGILLISLMAAVSVCGSRGTALYVLTLLGSWIVYSFDRTQQGLFLWILPALVLLFFIFNLKAQSAKAIGVEAR